MSGLGLGGLISGVNTDDIMKKIMELEQARIDLQSQKKAALQAKQTAWGQVKDSLTSLRTKLDGIRLASSFRTRKAVLSDESVASVSITSGATLATHTLTNVTKLAQAQVVASKWVDQATDALGMSGAITINGKQVTVASQDTLYGLRDKINGTADVGVIAEVVKDPVTSKYRMTLTSKTTGSASDVALANVDAGTLVADLGLTDAVGTKTVVQSGQNAEFTLDGTSYSTASNVISEAIQGVTITLKKATAAGASTDITVAQDSDKLASAVQAWVDGMNDTIALIADVTKYDSKTGAKGVLSGDSILRNVQSTLKGVLSSTVPGLPSGLDSLGDVGVTTGAWGTKDYGKILLDKSKLTAQLAANEDGVARIFGAVRWNVNVATGATVTSDSVAPGFDLSGIVDGNKDAAQFAANKGWQSDGAPTPDAKKSLTLDFGSLKSIDEVALFTPDGAATPTTGLKDFTVYYRNTQGQWKSLQSITGFTGTSRTIGFDPVLATAVKIEVSSTYGATPAELHEVEVHESNKGAAVQLYRYINSTLSYGTGPIDTRDATYSSQVKALDDRIASMNQRLADRQAQLKAQFDRMEQALSQLQAQGSQLAAMLGTSSTQK